MHVQQLLDFVSQERRLTGVALARIGLGSLLSIYYALHLLQRDFLWGPDGLYPLKLLLQSIGQTHAYTLYQFSSTDWYFNLIFFCGLIVSALFALGVQSRLTSVLFFVFTWSLYQRNYLAIDGGDNIAFIIAFYMMFADTGRCLSIDSLNALKPVGFLRGAVHNFAILACLTQIAILYFFAALAKAQSPGWLDGSAIYYILRAQEFYLPGISPWLYQSAFACVFACYATIVFEFFLPFEIWRRGLRPWVLLGAIILHLSIGLFMGLMYFSLNMIAIDLVVLSDVEYERLRTAVGGIVTHLRTRHALGQGHAKAGAN